MALVLAASAAGAAELRIGLPTAPTSRDPYYHNIGSNLQFSEYVYDRLITRVGGIVSPGLALSWRVLNPTTWEFVLRQDVSFHDGSPFGAEDVVASFERAERVKGPGDGLTAYLRAVKEVVVVGPHVIHIRTHGPYPLLPSDLSQFAILPRSSLTVGAEAVDAGEGIPGTGAFRLVEWRKGVGAVVEANPSWWGKPTAWDRVTFRYYPDDAERVTALVAGEVDMIAGLPPADQQRLKAAPHIRVVNRVARRVIYLALDQFNASSPFITDKRGEPLPRNPFKDARVRRAISKAINRAVLRDQVMEGLAEPASQLVLADHQGASRRQVVERFDLAGARALLAEAGWSDGFAVTLHCPAGRYVNDEQICQAIGRMLAALGIVVRVESVLPRDFFAQASLNAYSFMLAGWGTGTGESSYALKGLVATRDAAPGFGPSNFGRYSNARLDSLLIQAMSEFDDQRRAALQEEATDTALDDQAVIPLHFQMSLWAVRDTLNFTPSADEFTYAADVTPVR
ncbi:MAG: ABC transporter substrate-binding protein [Alphaproteobacteria bacterium]|nr:ABC transporter substrate-binding protein [Alphaproteobacteria bacterium]